MLNNLLHFIKYNNATIIILAIILILGGGALAAGPENIGQKKTSLEGLDNTALLAADLENFNMDFKIENIEQDEKYYYATYGFLDLAQADNLWQYQLSQKTQKVSKKIKQDLGEYLAKFMAKHYQARLRELKREKSLAQAAGEQKRVEVTEYSGLIGRTLDLAAKVFPGYEPVVKRELPAPEPLPSISPLLIRRGDGGEVDNLNKIYNDYLAAHPEIMLTNTDLTQTNADLSAASSSPSSADVALPEIPAAEETPAAPPAPAGSTGSPQAIPEPESVDIIELPASPSLGGPALTPVENIVPAEPAQVPAEPAPAPVESAPAQ